jgi:hypothetical protein
MFYSAKRAHLTSDVYWSMLPNPRISNEFGSKKKYSHVEFYLIITKYNLYTTIPEVATLKNVNGNTLNSTSKLL